MAYKNKEIENFLNRSKWFTRLFPNYKKFVNLIEFIDSLLDSQQKKILETEYEEKIVDFKTQLLIYFEDRYNFEINLWKLKEKVANILNKYNFLFTEKNLSSEQIRTALLRELICEISLDSQHFYIWEIKNTGSLRAGDKIREIIKLKYPNLPNIEEGNKVIPFYEKCFLDTYIFPNKSNESKNFWCTEFLKKTKWFLEKLNSCEAEFVNKYIEKYYQIVCVSLGRDINSSHRYTWSSNYLDLWMSFVVPNILPDTNIFLGEIVEEIISYFDKEELEKFSKIDSQGKSWSFKEQLLDRYYSRYSSFASLEEIKKQIKKKLDQYKLLLLLEKNKSEATLELFMDELEKELFVSKATHDWNKEMMKNLNISKSSKTSIGVSWAIEQILKLINYENLEINGKQYDLKTLLLARWKRAWLAQSKKIFKRRILSIFVQTPYHPKNWKSEEILKINLQTFLAEIDSCFLYPKKERVKKFLLNQDDTSAVTKFKKNLFSKLIKKNSLFYPVYLLYVHVRDNPCRRIF